MRDVEEQKVLRKFWGSHPSTAPNGICIQTYIRVNTVCLCVVYIITGYLSETSYSEQGWHLMQTQ